MNINSREISICENIKLLLTSFAIIQYYANISSIEVTSLIRIRISLQFCHDTGTVYRSNYEHRNNDEEEINTQQMYTVDVASSLPGSTQRDRKQRKRNSSKKLSRILMKQQHIARFQIKRQNLSNKCARFLEVIYPS